MSIKRSTHKLVEYYKVADAIPKDWDLENIKDRRVYYKPIYLPTYQPRGVSLNAKLGRLNPEEIIFEDAVDQYCEDEP